MATFYAARSEIITPLPWLTFALPFSVVLARLKILRGGWLDPFGYMAEQRMERQLIVTYRGMIDRILNEINAHNYDLAVQLAQTPAQIRGFGQVKHEAVGAVEAEQKSLLAQFHRAGTPASQVA